MFFSKFGNIFNLHIIQEQNSAYIVTVLLCYNHQQWWLLIFTQNSIFPRQTSNCYKVAILL